MPTCLFAHPGAELFGSDRMLLESVIAGREHGFDCVVALPERGPLVDALVAVGARVVISRGLVLRKALMRPSGWGRLAGDTLRGTAAAWRLIARVRPDCVYVNTVTIPLWPLVARARRVPAITHVHEAEASGSSLVNRLLYAPHLASRRVIANSEFSVRTIARSLGMLARRTSVVLNGVVGPPEAHPPRAALASPLRVAYVGRLSPRKGTDVLVEAARTLRDTGTDIRLDVLGSAFSGYEWFEAQLRDAIRDAGLEQRVVMHGFVDSIWPFLAEADVLVVPSTVDEPFGNTAVEGILALRPVVASDTSGLREAAGGYPTSWLVPPGDAVALAEALAAVARTWVEVVARVDSSASRAVARHAPAAYRARIGALLASTAAGR